MYLIYNQHWQNVDYRGLIVVLLPELLSLFKNCVIFHTIHCGLLIRYFSNDCIIVSFFIQNFEIVGRLLTANYDLTLP